MRHVPKRGTVDVSIHEVVAKELSMVKRIERLEPEFKCPGFRQLRELVKRNIVIGHPRPIEKPSR